MRVSTAGCRSVPLSNAKRAARHRAAAAAAPARTPPPLPRGFLKATTEEWGAWWRTPSARDWSDADVAAARRLIKLVDDVYRATDPNDRLRYERAVRLGSRELGLHRPDRVSDVRVRSGASWTPRVAVAGAKWDPEQGRTEAAYAPLFSEANEEEHRRYV
jgi:hypothetical protein